MPDLWLRKNKKASLVEITDNQIKATKYKTNNQQIEELIQNVTKNGINDEAREMLEKALVSGVIFEDLKNEIREVLK